jgi:integrase
MIPEKSYRPSGIKITIQNRSGLIRLIYTYQGQRQFISYPLNYFDSENQNIAIAKATEIHNDIYLYNRYDETKEKYKLNSQKKVIPINPDLTQITLKELWEYYKKNKQHISLKTKQVTWYPIDKLLDNLTPVENVADFVELLKEKYALSRVEKILKSLSAGINMSIKHGKFKGQNYLPNIINDLNIKKHKQIKSFNKEEVKAILSAFKDDTYLSKYSGINSHSFYYYFVAFRFFTGCRPSEAIALTWNDIIDNNGKIWIKFDKRYTDNELKEGTKNGVYCRLFPVNKQLYELLKEIPKRHPKLIFPNLNGDYLDTHNFSKRIWKKILDHLINDGLVKEYLTFYDIRHSYTTHLCRSGKADLQTIANIVGNSVPTLIRNYLAVDESLELPELF